MPPPESTKKAPAFGEVGCEVGLLHFKNTILFSFGMLDEVALEQPAMHRYCLVVERITLVPLGAVVDFKKADGHPRRMLIGTGDVSYSLPIEDVVTKKQEAAA